MPWKYGMRAAAPYAIGAASGLAGAIARYRGVSGKKGATFKRRTNSRLATVRNERSNLYNTRGWDHAIRGRLLPPYRWYTFTYVMDDVLPTSAVIGVAGAENAYALNDIFAPSRTSATAQANHHAYGSAQIGALYHKYMVYYCRVTLTIYTDDATKVFACMTTASPPLDTVAITGVPAWEAEERPGGQIIRIAPGGEHRWERTFGFYIRAMVGGRQFDETEFGAAFGASPTNFPVFRIAMANMSTVDVVNIKYTVRLEMKTKCWDRVSLAPSL